MKIVCDACSAKYSIADDKVKGKVFKIRCKKCSNIIVVRGSGPGAAGGAEEAPPAGFDQKETRVYDYGADGEAGGGDEAVWHVVVDQEQVGPVSAAEIQRKFTGGEIDADTFIWREGFADWQPLSQVEPFAAMVAGGGAPLGVGHAPAAGGHDDGLFGGPASDEGGTQKSDPNDLFAAAASPGAAGALGGEDEDEGGGDLFGAGRGAGQRRSEEMAAASPRGGGAAADKKLRGERNENSVLFSLGNLAALASDAPRSSAASSGGGGGASAASASSSAPSGSAQMGGGEGSGLIDIRSMASAYLGGEQKGGAAKSRPQVGSVDDLPVFSSASFSEPVVIMPTGRSGGTDKKLLYALVAVVGLLALVAIVLVVMVLTGGKKETPQVAMGGGTGSVASTGPGTGAGTGTEPGNAGNAGNAGTGSSAASGTAPGSASGSAPGSAVASGSEPGSGSAVASGSAGSAAGSAATPPTPTGHGHKDPKNPKGTRVADATPPGGHKDPKHTDTTPPGGDTTPKGGKCMDEVGCLLADHPPACCSQYKNAKPKGGGTSTSTPEPGGGAVDSSLPEELDRAAVSDGVGKVRGKINGCGDRSSAKGEVKVSVKVSPSGSVANVSVKNTPDPALGSCVASAMQGAHFPKTQKGGSFSYPFIFR